MFLGLVNGRSLDKRIPHNVGMFLYNTRKALKMKRIPHNVGMFPVRSLKLTTQKGIPHNVGMFLID